MENPGGCGPFAVCGLLAVDDSMMMAALGGIISGGGVAVSTPPEKPKAMPRTVTPWTVSE